jgi:acyl-CoA reductase-like NAD-dependent aldehyde dehydrogenase
MKLTCGVYNNLLSSGIQKVSSEKEAIELVNDSDLGLTGGVFTKDAERYTCASLTLAVGNELTI